MLVEIEMSTIGDRVRERREAMGLNQAQLAALVGQVSGNKPLTQQAIAAIEGNDIKSPRRLADIAAALGVSESYLRFGAEGSKPEIATRPENALTGLLDYKKTQSGTVSVSNIEPGPELREKVPLISWVQAGSFSEAIDLYHKGDAEMWVLSPVKHSKSAYALRVRGSSMEPRFRDGEVIIVDPELPADPGKFVVAKRVADNEVTFKQLIMEGSQAYLKALNPDWPERYIRMGENEWMVCGVAICKVDVL